MDEKRYEKIDGREALDRMEKGEEVYDRSGVKYHKIFGEIRYLTMSGDFKATNMSINHFLFGENWYIPKPFDVRQAMREREDEWVGFCTSENGQVYKVGFDSNRFRAVCARIHIVSNPDYREQGVVNIRVSELDNCQPIEDYEGHVG